MDTVIPGAAKGQPGIHLGMARRLLRAARYMNAGSRLWRVRHDDGQRYHAIRHRGKADIRVLKVPGGW